MTMLKLVRKLKILERVIGLVNNTGIILIESSPIRSHLPMSVNLQVLFVALNLHLTHIW